jgi:O-antigen/teichoic acid export membrane protein
LSGLGLNQNEARERDGSPNEENGEFKNGAQSGERRRFLRVVERWTSSRLASRFAGDFFWLTVASIAARIGALISMILVARILGAVVYGEFCLIRSTVNGFVVLASFGMGRTATKYVAELTATDKARVGRVIALNYVFSFISSVVVAALFCLLTPTLYREIPEASRLISQTRLSSILLISSAVVSAQAGVMSGFKAFRGLAVATAASGLGSIPFFVLGAYWGGLTGAILGFASGALLNYLINGCFIYFQLKKHGIRYRFDEFWRERGILWNFCLPQTLTSVATGMAGTIATVILAGQENGIAEVAIFESARQIQTSVLYLPNIATQALLPTLTEFNALKDKARYVKTLKYNALINVLFAVATALAACVLAPWAMRAFGEGFENGVSTLVLLLGVGVVLSVCNVCASALTSLGAVWSGFFLNAIWGVVFLTGAWQATSRGCGAFGLAVSSLVAYVVYLLCCLAFIKKRLA